MGMEVDSVAMLKNNRHQYEIAVHRVDQRPFIRICPRQPPPAEFQSNIELVDSQAECSTCQRRNCDKVAGYVMSYVRLLSTHQWHPSCPLLWFLGKQSSW